MAIRRKVGAPQSYTWTFPVCPHDVNVDLSVIRTLAEEPSVASGSRQGVLLGGRQTGLTRIAAMQPLPSLDVANFEAEIAAAGRPVVGYYRIRQGSAFILDPAEIALAKALFSAPGSVVLLVEPRGSGVAEATFAFWRGEAFVSNLPRPFPLDAAALAAVSEPAPPEPAESRFSILRRSAAATGLVLVTVLAIWLLPLTWSNSGTPAERGTQPSVAPAVSPVDSPVSGTSGDIQIAWDSRTLSTATAGLLRIVDGDLHHHVSLDLGQLRSGSVVYTPGAGPVSAVLKVLLSDGEMLEVPVSARPALQSVPPPPAAPELPRRTPHRSPPPAPVERRAAKSFALASPGGGAPESASALPDAPILSVKPPVAPIVTVSLPAPAPPARVRLGPPVDRPTPAGSGRLIWTGTLERRGVVEFDGRSVSVGSLTGSLPGVPVNVTVSPAEFSSDGLVVYTTDARLNHHIEPPGAANGWNRITYSWDPARAGQVAILETPNPSNRFSHLALRSDAPLLSMLVIDWNVQAATSR